MWKPIRNFEDLYLVSDEGEIYSLITNKVLKHAIKRNGYHQVTLTKDKKLSYRNVHDLVAESFIPNPEGKKQVNHKDGDKSNNSVENLEWCTCKENILHAIYTLGQRKVPVAQYTKTGVLVNVWDSIVEASENTGIKAQHIWRNANDIRNSTGGFVFRYVNKGSNF